jgi:IPT/TIG domain/Bacterial Ig-like domain (group 2)/Galactose oxidase, central domain
MSPRTRVIYRAVLFLSALFLVATSVVAAAPSITSLTPTSGAVGASVTIAGSGFGSTQGSSTVKFNGTTATITTWGASSIVAKVPTGATTGNVVVTVSGVASNGKSFTVLPTPSITSLSPTSGAVGASVTIAGGNFGSTQGTSTVKFNGTTATVTTWGASSIVAAVPSGATTGNVIVNTSGVNTNGISFTVLAAPSITSLTPTSGAVGASVTIAGSNFGATQGSSTVKFNGASATVTTWSATSIVATVPTGATTGNVVVHASGVDSAGKAFTVVAAPSITSLSPTSGAVGASVTITGSNFGSTQGSSTVKFNGTTATITSWAAGSIVTKVPTGATTGNVVVHASGVDSNGSSFTVLPTPSITTLSPTSGAVGAQVTITGTNFGSTQGTSTAKFNGTTAAIISWSATSIVVTVPTGATTGNVVVTVSAVASNGVSFTVVAAPSITSLAPTSATVGTSVTITGTNFGSSQGNGTVKFNGTSGTPSSWTATSIKVPVPSGATSGNVVVHASGVDSNGSAFMVLSTPTITVLSETSGMIGDDIIITGTNFGSSQGTSTVKFNGTTATPINWTNTSIETTVPSGASSGNIVVTVSGASSAGTAFIVYITPSISSLSPTSGAAGASVTINGSGFQATQLSSTVTFNGVAATPSSWSNTQIKAPVPAGATTGSVVVTTDGLSSSGTTFTVKPTPTISSVAPSSGAPSVVVTISGTNFGSSQGSSTVQFNGTSATPSSWTANQIVVPVPTGASTGNLVVHTSGIDVSAGTFRIVTISSLAVTPANLTLALNSRQRFVALATNSDSTTEDISRSVTWSSSATSVATIDSTGVLTAVAQGQANMQAVFGSLSGSTSITIKGRTFVPVGSMMEARLSPTATLLPGGKVLITGGSELNSLSGTAELYDPIAKSFSYTGLMTTARTLHTATLLGNGQVLIVGGVAPIPNAPGYSQETATAELYNPTTGSFTSTGSMHFPRYGHTATLLSTGKVLVVGGYQNNGDNSVSTAEVYDPSTNTFSSTDSLSPSRGGATVTSLNDGTTLVAGGITSFLAGTILNGSEIYNPSTATFSAIANLPFAEYQQSATVLANGTVLIADGNMTSLIPHAATYDPVAQTFSVIASPAMARLGHSATFLNDGTVLLVGGEDPSLNLTYTTAELYNPATQTFIGAGATATLHSPGGGSFLQTGGSGHTATLLNDGTVLVVGGNVQNAVAEVYEPGAPAPVSIQITPSSATIVDGNTQTFSAVDDQGQTRTDAIWTISDSTTASLQSSTVPTLTGIKPGQVLLTADVDGVEAQIQVNVAPVSLQITPASATLLVGDSHQFAVVDERGRPGNIATWTVDNTTLATITADAAPTLTAEAAGQVNLTATVVGVSTQIPVTISPAVVFNPGDVLWSAPPVLGFTPQGLFQAFPTDTGPALISVQAGTGNQSLVQGLTTDGQQLWQTALPFAYTGVSVPDGFGGLIVVGACDANNSIPLTIVDIDLNGGTDWQTQITSTTPGVCPPSFPKIAIGLDGTVIVSNVAQVSPALVILDGRSGGTISAPPIPPSTFINTSGQSTNCDCFSIVGQPIINIDGSVSVEYEVRQVQFLLQGGSTTTTSSVSLLNIATDYSTTNVVQLSSATFADLFPSSMIPDGQGGTLATWTIVDSFNLNTGQTPIAPQPYQAADVVAGAVVATYPLPNASPNLPPHGSDGLPIPPPLLLGQNGTAFVSYGTNITSFQIASGSSVWNYPAPPQSSLTPLASTDNGSLVVDNLQNGIIQLDPSGDPSQLVAGNFGGSETYSWTSGWFVGGTQAVSAIELPVEPDPGSPWGMLSGGSSQNFEPEPPCDCLLQTSADSDSNAVRAPLQGFAQRAGIVSAPVSAPAAVVNCPICALPAPVPLGANQAPSCTTFSAGGPTYVLLVGDSGTEGHNNGQNFNIAAQTAANNLVASGNNVVACRVSSVENVVTALTTNGSIGGGITYFGHGGPYNVYDPTGKWVGELSLLGVGNGTETDTNIEFRNVAQLAAVQTANNQSNIIASGASWTTNGCKAAKIVMDYYGHKPLAVAQEIADQIRRNVYAYSVGMYFSTHDIATATSSNYLGEPDPLPASLPLYLVPPGPPGHKPGPKLFTPH